MLWTIHNRTPHRQKDAHIFFSARREMCSLADAIHVHTQDAKDYMQCTYDIDPGLLNIIPHPSYLGTYEATEKTVSRPLPIAEQRRFLFFGMMRSDKGLDDIYTAQRRLNRHNWRFHLDLIGKAFRSQRRRLRFMNAESNVSVLSDRVPDEDVPAIFGRAQIFLAPYKNPFTSGTMMLAQTFGLPIIGPDLPAVRDTTPQEAHRFLYDPDDANGLLRKMKAAIAMEDLEINEIRHACFRFSQERSPVRVSREVHDLLERIRLV